MAQIADLIGGVTTRDGPPVPVRHVVEPSRKDARFLVDRSCGNIFSMNHFYMMTNGGVGVEWLFVVCFVIIVVLSKHTHILHYRQGTHELLRLSSTK